ncbi:glycosyltransferase [Gallaecimonas sp. GXIMD4217]|uniref:glycosyltransferase family 2 protein n=1 Tax=Gallaecimonas sp. GXIMD4217 TaxID=3131927 RepID=UPI00311B38DA
MSVFKPCLVVPNYNHGAAAEKSLPALAELGLPIFLVDDGSDAANAALLDELAGRFEQITLIRHQHNQGKGGAVMTGLRAAHEAGYSHGLQVDADGQHNLDDVPRFLAEAKARPQALIAGYPAYDDSVPKGRLYARYITHVWVWIETLSLTIKDSMCGFRVYPLAPCVALFDKVALGRRMDFDIEVMVRLYWQGVPIRQLETRVIYPEDGASHFRAFEDNVLISKMHTKLFFGMLWRLPRLLFGQPRPKTAHWSATAERGSLLGMKCLWWSYRLLGRPGFRVLLWPVMGYFFLFGHSRRHSLAYLRRLWLSSGPLPGLRTFPGLWASFRHHLSFGEAILDKLAAWMGDIHKGRDLLFDDENQFQAVLAGEQGALLIGSHLGNLELCRALSKGEVAKPMTVLVLTEHALRFNELMTSINPDAGVNMMQVSQVGPDTTMILRERIDRGELVVIVADRTSAGASGHVVEVPFLGAPAPFPTGPFILASLLECPVYLLNCLKEGDRHRLHMEPFAPDGFKLPRKTRQQELRLWVGRYADRLAHYCRQAPLQWFNFFDFWQGDQGRRTGPSNNE